MSRAPGVGAAPKRVLPPVEETTRAVLCTDAGRTLPVAQVSSDTPATLRRKHGAIPWCGKALIQTRLDWFPLRRNKAGSPRQRNCDCGNRGYPQYVGTSRSSLTAEREMQMILVQRTCQHFSLFGTPDIGSTPISASTKKRGIIKKLSTALSAVTRITPM